MDTRPGISRSLKVRLIGPVRVPCPTCSPTCRTRDGTAALATVVPLTSKVLANGYARDRPATSTLVTGEIARKLSDQAGFTVHPHRWNAKRFFPWIN